MTVVTEQNARRQRLAAVRRAYAHGAQADHDYDEITAAWDEAGEDGLTDA